MSTVFEQKHWLQRHWLLAPTVIIIATLFMLGLALHELNIITPFDGFYMWLHSLAGGEPMASLDNWRWS